MALCLEAIRDVIDWRGARVIFPAGEVEQRSSNLREQKRTSGRGMKKH